MSAKGKTRWYPRHIHPVRNGSYECLVRITSVWMLEWDGHRFLVPFPMVVRYWRGQTKKAVHGIKEKNT